jgi:hypothetical protein
MALSCHARLRSIFTDHSLEVQSSGVEEISRCSGKHCKLSFFPASTIIPGDLFRALANAVGPTSPKALVDGEGSVVDAGLGAALAGYLGRLTQALSGSSQGASDFANAIGTWRNELTSLGGDALPTNKLPISIGDSGAAHVQLEAWSGSVSWNCQECQREGTLLDQSSLERPRNPNNH